MREFARDFRRYVGVGFSIREAFDIARTLRRVRQALAFSRAGVHRA